MTEDLELAVVRTSPIPKTAAVETTIGRYLQEIQGMVFMAKQYPREASYEILSRRDNDGN